MDKVWLSLGQELNDLFTMAHGQTKPGMEIASLKASIEERLAPREAFHVSIQSETLPHDNELNHGLLLEGSLYTLDIAFRMQSQWIDGAVSFPCGQVEDQKKYFLIKILHNHKMLLKSIKPGLSFNHWIEEQKPFLQPIVENMGGHGLGFSLHEYPELIYSRRNNYRFMNKRPFTLEPVYETSIEGRYIYGYYESSILLCDTERWSYPDIEIMEKFLG